MNTRQQTKHDPRKLKLAEAGVLFVLVLGVAIAVGVNVASHQDETAPVEVAEVVETTLPETTPVVAEIQPEPEAAVQPETPAETAYVPPASAGEIYRDGEAAYHGGAYDQAADIFAVYVDRAPDNAWGHYMRGLSLWKAGALEDAELSLRAALVIAPDHTKSLVNLARVLLAQDRPEDALPVIAAADALLPGDGQVKRMTGRVLHNLGRVDKAIAAYREALTVDIDDVWALNNLGLLLIEDDRCDEAVAPLARAVGLAADTAVFQNNLGMALERSGHPGQAAEAYAAALAADAAYAKAEVSLARIETVAAARPDAAPLDLVAVAAAFTVAPAGTEIVVVDIEPEPEFAIAEIEQ
ncbi:tetratricopeptide repeat protein [bacterium]|nr:tetratricopeptide repeat protein [bacterium]